MVICFAKAFETFKNPIYLDEAISASDIIWERGDLLKGPGKKCILFYL